MVDSPDNYKPLKISPGNKNNNNTIYPRNAKIHS